MLSESIVAMQFASTDWLEECERIITGTQACTQQIGPEHPPPAARRPQLPIAGSAAAPWPPDRIAHPVSEWSDLRQDLNSRVEAFRARQQALRAERETHYEDAIYRIKSITAGWQPDRTTCRSFVAESVPEPSGALNVDAAWERIWLSIVDVAGTEERTHGPSHRPSLANERA